MFEIWYRENGVARCAVFDKLGTAQAFWDKARHEVSLLSRRP